MKKLVTLFLVGMSLNACAGSGNGFEDRTSSQDLEESPCACNYEYKMIGGQLFKKDGNGNYKPVERGQA